MKKITTFLLVCTMIFSAIEINAQCCGTTVDISSNGSVTAYIGDATKIFKVYNGGQLLAEFNEYNGDVIPPVIESEGPNGAPITLPCQGGNFWFYINCPGSDCVFNASQQYSCKTGETLSTETIDIYPNPAIDFINIDLPFIEEVYRINVLDLSGKIIETISSNGGQMMLSTANLNAGLYMVNVEGETSVYTKKIHIVK